MNLTDYHAKYYAYELTKRCSSDSLEKLAGAVAGAQVDLNPHQVDAARGTDGKIYMLGWDQSQQDRNEAPSIKKVILLAPGFHPLTPDGVFKTA